MATSDATPALVRTTPPPRRSLLSAQALPSFTLQYVSSHCSTPTSHAPLPPTRARFTGLFGALESALRAREPAGSRARTT
eukprot:scaffold6237_cov336-Prasinococcus_capsulatus_cf.AAC.2